MRLVADNKYQLGKYEEAETWMQVSIQHSNPSTSKEDIESLVSIKLALGKNEEASQLIDIMRKREF